MRHRSALIICRSGFSQTVNDIPLKDFTAQYVEIVGTRKPLTNKVLIEIDFGQVNKVWNFKDMQLRDKDNKPIILNSMIDALNFMCKNGYDFVQAYAYAEGSQSVYHYLMRRQENEALEEVKHE